MSRYAIFFIAILFFVYSNVGLTAFPQASPTATQASLRALLVQRRDTLRERLKYLEAMAHVGGRSPLHDSFARATEATRDLFHAELELAETHDERVRIHEKLLARLRQSEKMYAQLFEDGVIAEHELLKARAERLRAEIDLLRARGTDTHSGK